MNKPLGVIGEHDPVERVFVRHKVGEAVVGRSRDRHWPLMTSPIGSLLERGLLLFKFSLEFIDHLVG